MLDVKKYASALTALSRLSENMILQWPFEGTRVADPSADGEDGVIRPAVLWLFSLHLLCQTACSMADVGR